MVHGLETIARINSAASTRQPATVKQVVVCTDRHSNEAIYVDRKYVFSDVTIYAADIANAVGDSPITFEQRNLDVVVEEWPRSLDDLPRQTEES